MAIERKRGVATGTNALTGQIPSPPALPETFVNRFPELQSYQQEFTKWWEELLILLQRDRDAINSRFNQDEAKIRALENP